MTQDKPQGAAQVAIQDAQAEIDGLLVAEILRDFQSNFDGVYPDYVLARGVGPEQSMIGLAIKRGHLARASIPAPVVTVEMLAAFERQSDNMAFVLNHVTLPSQWCDKFTLELEQDRAAIAQMKEKP